MITCVCFGRLDRMLVSGRYTAPLLRREDLLAIQRCVANALQLHIDCADSIE